MSDLEFRSAQISDGPAIMDLFWQVSPRGTTVRYWDWQNFEGPYGNSIIEVIELGGQPIGHYSVRPMELVFGGQVKKAGFAMQAMTHRSYRSLANLRKMCGRIWQRCEEAGMMLVYGFPNDNIWPIYARMMDWVSIDRYHAHTLTLDQYCAKKFPADPSISVKRISEFDLQFNDLWERSPQAGSDIISVRRGVSYLNWRFFGSPEYHYKVLAAWSDGRPVGYIGLKFYHNGKEFLGHIVEMLTQSDGAEEISSALIQASQSAFEWQNVDMVSFWNSPSLPAHRLFDEMGFESDGFVSQFAYRPIETDLSWPVGDISRWNIQMSDSDAF